MCEWLVISSGEMIGDSIIRQWYYAIKVSDYIKVGDYIKIDCLRGKRFRVYSAEHRTSPPMFWDVWYWEEEFSS